MSGRVSDVATGRLDGRRELCGGLLPRLPPWVETEEARRCNRCNRSHVPLSNPSRSSDLNAAYTERPLPSARTVKAITNTGTRARHRTSPPAVKNTVITAHAVRPSRYDVWQ